MALIQKGFAELHKFNEANDGVVRIDFKYPYLKRPLVNVGLVAIDDWNGGQIRLQTKVTKVHTHYVEIEIDTWHVSKIWWAKVEWMAIGNPANGISIEDTGDEGDVEAITI